VPGKEMTRLLSWAMVVVFSFAIGMLCMSRLAVIAPEPVMWMEFRTGEIPVDVPVFSVYEDQGIVTLVSSMRPTYGPLLPFNVYGGPVPYECLDPPRGWVVLPAHLLEILR